MGRATPAQIIQSNKILDRMIEQMTRFEDAVIINQFEEIATAQKKKIVGITFRQYCIFKKIKNTEHFFEMKSLSKPTIYFKMNLYKLIKKYPCLKSHHNLLVTLLRIDLK